MDATCPKVHILTLNKKKPLKPDVEYDLCDD